MVSVSNNSNVPYTSANVGVLTPPNHIAGYKLTDSDLSDKYERFSKDIFSKQKPVAFETKRKTPVLAKIILGVLGVLLLWRGGRAILKARK